MFGTSNNLIPIEIFLQMTKERNLLSVVQNSWLKAVDESTALLPYLPSSEH
jgi:hypothetical protein